MSAPQSLDQLDGYLLRVLCVLLEERSVSRAARRLDQGQPATSAALKRLRCVFNDPLLVRDKLGMIPTARALELELPARSALDAVAALVAPPSTFEARNTMKVFRIGSPDYLAPSLLARLLKRLRVDAPLCRVEVHPLGPDFDAARVLADDQMDVIIGNWAEPPETLHMSRLLEDDLVCLLRKGHPLGSAPMTEERYFSAAHVIPMRYSCKQKGVVDSHLATLSGRRDVRVTVPYFAFAPYVVAETDLVFITSRHFAEPFVRTLDLEMLAAPRGFPKMRFYQLWHPRAHHANSHRWLRGLIGEAGREVMTWRLELGAQDRLEA